MEMLIFFSFMQMPKLGNIKLKQIIRSIKGAWVKKFKTIERIFSCYKLMYVSIQISQLISLNHVINIF